MSRDCEGCVGRSGGSSYRWVFYVASGFLYAGAVLRSPLVIEDTPVLAASLLLLLAALVLFLTEPMISRRWRPWFTAYLVMQTAIVVALLSLPGDYDFFAVLFGVLSMQAMERGGARTGTLWIAAFIPLTALALWSGTDPGAVAAFVLVYTALDVALGVYVLTTRRAVEARAASQVLAAELETANGELRAYSRRLEGLAVARERNRVARELHDSVTQTIFSMNLTSQSALLLEGQPARVRAQLDRLTELTKSALAEMHTLILELAPDVAAGGGLAKALRREVDRRAEDGLTVSLQVDEPPVAPGTGLSSSEEQGLLRIAQEALNNVAKHAGTSDVAVRLRLWEPFRLEIEDRGAGFDPARTPGGGIGLASMSERATEIGWRVAVHSRPEEGTTVVAERLPPEERSP